MIKRLNPIKLGIIAAIVSVAVSISIWLWQTDAINEYLGPRPLIVMPAEVHDGAYQNVVGVTFGGNIEPTCTGSLIAPKIVLTAAHCLCGLEAARKHVLVGKRAVANEETRFYEVVDYRRRMLPCSSKISGSDLALLELRNPVFGVPPTAFATDIIVDSAVSYRIVGFGATNTAGTVFPKRKLQSRDPVPTRTNSCSAANDASSYRCFPGKEIVAGREKTPDTCKGDSGGPLLVNPQGTGGELNGRNFSLAGVTSRGIANSPVTCGYGGIYERIDSEARGWIKSKSDELLRTS